MAIIVPLTAIGCWTPGWEPWDTAHSAETAPFNEDASPSVTSGKGGTNSCLIRRAAFTADLSSVPPATVIYSAKLYMEYASGANNSGLATYATLVDGTGVSRDNTGYHDLLAATASLGALLIPHSVFLPQFLGVTKEIHFNAAGIALLQSSIGGSLDVGMRMQRDIDDDEPSGLAQIYFSFSMAEEYDFWIELNYAIGCYTWVEGTKFAYLDAFRMKRLTEGSLVGGSGDAGYKWVDGDYQYYTDYLGNVRRILGTLTGLTGKLASQISINTKAPMLGTHYCYIDDTGAERCFEGAT